MSNLNRIAQHGQSIWVDELHRAWLEEGEVGRMIEEDSVTGMTSNPTIFAEAVRESESYDEQLGSLARQDADVDEMYVAMVTQDIQGACDLFWPIWEETGGRDGYVSVEVSPALAYDTERTIEEARAWHKRIGRPNLLVKIPATEPGLPAIEQMIAEGHSINVTLTFGLERYRRVTEAYLRGLERFAEAGGDPSTVFSVASFFVSRVDTEVDRRLDRNGTDRARQLRGRIGIANARAAYRIFREVFAGNRWQGLEAQGAGVQKVLWASTSVKDPAYRDTMYVEELLAPETVNTLPRKTILAFQDHGDASVEPFWPEHIEQARRDLERLAELGIDYDDVVRVLEEEGVEKFAASFRELMDALAEFKQTAS